MANFKNKLKLNVAGAYYVDDQCIACDACVVEAAAVFSMNDDEGHAFVMKQPKTKSEIEDAENARSACPVDAIGNDGDKNN